MFLPVTHPRNGSATGGQMARLMENRDEGDRLMATVG